MIRRRDPGHFDSLIGPVVLSVVLFTAVLANFIVRVRDLRRKGVPIPGADLLGFATVSPAVTVSSYPGQAVF